MKFESMVRSGIVVAATLALVACGGSGSGDSPTLNGGNGGNSIDGGGGSEPGPQQAESRVVVGTITGFGSVYVAGVKFETDNASYRVDDEDRFDDSALALGMKVKIEGTVNADGVTGNAESIIYDDDIEGPIDSGSIQSVDETSKTFSIFGLQILASETDTVYDDGASFAGLTEGQVLEISGYFDETQLVASRIELQDDVDDEFELKGHISAYDGSFVSLILLNGQEVGPYAIGDAAEQEIPADPVGIFVELELRESDGELIVIEIEAEDDDLLDDDAGEVSIRGILKDDGAGGFTIEGIPLEINAAAEFEPESLRDNLVAGLDVKVEGRMQDGVLIVEEVESEQGDIEIEARLVDVASTDAKSGTVTVAMGGGQVLEILVDGSALFEDDSDLDMDDDDSFNLDELNPGSDFLEIEATLGGAGQLVAQELEREDESDDTKLEAAIDDFESGVSVTLLGITWTVDSNTEYEIEDDRVDAMTFFDRLAPGDIVKVKDSQPDGIADEIDLED